MYVLITECCLFIQQLYIMLMSSHALMLVLFHCLGCINSQWGRKYHTHINFTCGSRYSLKL